MERLAEELLDRSPANQARRIHRDVRFYRLRTHLGVLGNPVSQHIENSVGSSSPDDEFFVTGFLRVTKAWEKEKERLRRRFETSEVILAI